MIRSHKFCGHVPRAHKFKFPVRRGHKYTPHSHARPVMGQPKTMNQAMGATKVSNKRKLGY